MPTNSNESPLVKDSAALNSTSMHMDCTQCFEGETLSLLLNSVRNAIESEKKTNKFLPEKIWFKQQFAMGVNEVTRILERMPPSLGDGQNRLPFHVSGNLQVVLVASDCNPRWLTKHLPSLAASRGVPVVHIKDRKEGSLRLGELFNLKTAIAVGVKAKGKNINKLFKQILGEEGKDSWKELSSSLPCDTQLTTM